MAKGPREPRGGLGSGHVPDDAFDDDPDTNVDERPAVPLSPLSADSDDTSIDQAPTIDPTTRRPLGTPLARPITERSAERAPARERSAPARERSAQDRAPPPKAAPPQGAPSKSRLRLPLPAGMGGGSAKPDEDDPTPPPRIAPSLPLGASDREAPHAMGTTKVRTMPGVERRARWPIYAAVGAVAVIVIAFLVASETQTPTADGRLASLGPNATAEARRAELMRQARMSGHAMPDLGPDGHPRAPGVRPAPTTRTPPPSAPRRTQMMPPEEPLPFMSLLKEPPDESNYPKYNDDAPPEQPPLLLIESDPMGVPVYLDDVLIGATPVLQAVPADKKGGKILFAKLGLVPKVVNFTLDGPGTKQIFEKLEVDAQFDAKMKAMASSPRPE